MKRLILNIKKFYNNFNCLNKNSYLKMYLNKKSFKKIMFHFVKFNHIINRFKINNKIYNKNNSYKI